MMAKAQTSLFKQTVKVCELLVTFACLFTYYFIRQSIIIHAIGMQNLFIFLQFSEIVYYSNGKL